MKIQATETEERVRGEMEAELKRERIIQETLRTTNEENNADLKNVLRRKRKIDTQVTASEGLLATDILINHGMYYDTRQLPIIRHPYGNNDVRCKPVNQSNCEPDRIIFKAHGPQTGMCVASDR